MTNEIIKRIVKEIKSGEPYSYHREKGLFIIGVQVGDEIEVYLTRDFEIVYNKYHKQQVEKI